MKKLIHKSVTLLDSEHCCSCCGCCACESGCC